MPNAAKPEVYTRERCYVRELVNSTDWPEVSIARCRVEPGVTTELHAVSVDEWYVIEQGAGLMTVGDQDPFDVGPGSVVAIPHRTPQRIKNRGNDDLVFLCVCTPRFSQDCYNSLE